MRKITFGLLLAATIIVSGVVGVSDQTATAEKGGDPGGASIRLD